jgi:hypothetical protein
MSLMKPSDQVSRLLSQIEGIILRLHHSAKYRAFCPG